MLPIPLKFGPIGINKGKKEEDGGGRGGRGDREGGKEKEEREVS